MGSAALLAREGAGRDDAREGERIGFQTLQPIGCSVDAGELPEGLSCS